MDIKIIYYSRWYFMIINEQMVHQYIFTRKQVLKVIWVVYNVYKRVLILWIIDYHYR